MWQRKDLATICSCLYRKGSVTRTLFIRVLSHNHLISHVSLIFLFFYTLSVMLTSSWPISFYSLPSSSFYFPTTSGSGGSEEEQGGSAPWGAKDVAFSSEHLQPPGVNPGCPPVPVEHQTLYHMSGNHCSNWQDIPWKQRFDLKLLFCRILFLLFCWDKFCGVIFCTQENLC